MSRPRPSCGAFRIFAAVLMAASSLVLVTSAAGPVGAAGSQHGLPPIVVNPGGGGEADGSDGVRLSINNPNGFDQVEWAGTAQYCCGAAAPMLNIGGTLYGEAGAAISTGSASWTAFEIISTSGSTSTTGGTDTGSGGATVRYSVIKNGLTYVVERAVSYTFPNDYVSEQYTFTIPADNTEVVKFYMGGDTAPGSSDQGYGIMLTSPVRQVISLNTASQIQFGYREVPGGRPFTGATSQHYSSPYVTVFNGGDIGFAVTEATHDAGLMVQWDLGSTPGVQTGSMQQFVNRQGTSLTAEFRDSSTETGEPVLLDLNVVNTFLTSQSPLGFTFTLPAGLEVDQTAPVNGCGGTLIADGSTITLSGASVEATTNCVVSVPVVADAAGLYEIGAAAVSGLTGLTNGVGTSTLEVVAGPAPPGGGGGDPVEPTPVASPCANIEEHAFADTSASVHEANIDCLAWWGVTTGTAGTSYSPSAALTRGQAASLVLRLLALTDGALPDGPDAFVDDDGSVHEPAINALAAAQLVAGHDDGTFGPRQLVTRGQLVSMVLAARDHVAGPGGASGGDHYTDDDGNVHEADIDRATNLGLALGHADGSFAPNDDVTRAQAASFLVRLLEDLAAAGHLG